MEMLRGHIVVDGEPTLLPGFNVNDKSDDNGLSFVAAGCRQLSEILRVENSQDSLRNII